MAQVIIGFLSHNFHDCRLMLINLLQTVSFLEKSVGVGIKVVYVVYFGKNCQTDVALCFSELN
ncbi:hypothetical protein SDC9_211690 [bioreactor metagenome]|uniref:Uncharacterized protein n=1 Tax=bioreactor metagenome TaxID=1076179 RepID=A0A645JXR3_9ZZZZ